MSWHSFGWVKAAPRWIEMPPDIACWGNESATVAQGLLLGKGSRGWQGDLPQVWKGVGSDIDPELVHLCSCNYIHVVHVSILCMGLLYIYMHMEFCSYMSFTCRCRCLLFIVHSATIAHMLKYSHWSLTDVRNLLEFTSCWTTRVGDHPWFYGDKFHCRVKLPEGIILVSYWPESKHEPVLLAALVISRVILLLSNCLWDAWIAKRINREAKPRSLSSMTWPGPSVAHSWSEFESPPWPTKPMGRWHTLGFRCLFPFTGDKSQYPQLAMN